MIKCTKEIINVFKKLHILKNYEITLKNLGVPINVRKDIQKFIKL